MRRPVGSVIPLMLAALRFTFSVFPAIFLVKKPAASWKLLAGYGLFLGVVEFGFLFTAIKLGAPAGLNSLILQSQAFFDEKDRPVLAAAIKASCALLITGDATHFGALFGKTIQSVLILNPRQAAAMLQGNMSPQEPTSPSWISKCQS